MSTRTWTTANCIVCARQPARGVPHADDPEFFSIINVSVPVGHAKTFEGALQGCKRRAAGQDAGGEPHGCAGAGCRGDGEPGGKGGPAVYGDAGTRFVFAFFSEDVKTMTVSNVGLIDLPADMLPYVNHAESIIPRNAVRQLLPVLCKWKIDGFLCPDGQGNRTHAFFLRLPCAGNRRRSNGIYERLGTLDGQV